MARRSEPSDPAALDGASENFDATRVRAGAPNHALWAGPGAKTYAGLAGPHGGEVLVRAATTRAVSDVLCHAQTELRIETDAHHARVNESVMSNLPGRLASVAGAMPR